MDGPRGPRPQAAFSRRNIMLYGTLIVVALYYLLPLYVMVVTSLKGMPEIRLGNIFCAAGGNHFRALGEGLGGGLHRAELRRAEPRFLEFGKITVPSVFLSIAIASVNGYALANWRFKGADVFFTILIFGAFIPIR
jgi:glucose/mannose transport system permease protein